MSVIKTTKVYYNSACPICKTAIQYQKNRMQGLNILWNDIHCDINARYDIDTNLEFIRKKLHVIDSSGNIHIGIDAFIHIWRLSPGETWKAGLFSLPIIHTIAAFFYNTFAWLLYHCNIFLNHW